MKRRHVLGAHNLGNALMRAEAGNGNERAAAAGNRQARDAMERLTPS